MDAFIAVPIATAVGVGLTAVVLAGSTSPRRTRWLLGDRIERFDAVRRDVLDAELTHAARNAHRGMEAGALALLIILFIRCMPIVADALARAPFSIAVSGLIATVGAGVLVAYVEFAWIRAAILRRLERRLATP